METWSGIQILFLLLYRKSCQGSANVSAKSGSIRGGGGGEGQEVQRREISPWLLDREHFAYYLVGVRAVGKRAQVMKHK